MKSFVIGIACVLLLVSFVPLVTAQEEQPIEQPPIIPPELAEGISEIGMGPVISLVFDAIDTLIAFVFDVIDTLIALGYTAISTYSLWGLILGFMGATPFLGLVLVWVKGAVRVVLCFFRYMPIAGWFIRAYDYIKFLMGPIPLL